MDTAKVYYDIDGNECSIWDMVRNEPEWAVNRIQEGERAIARIAEHESTIQKHEFRIRELEADLAEATRVARACAERCWQDDLATGKDQRIAEQESRIRELEAALSFFCDVVSDTSGLYGYEPNGELSPWSDWGDELYAALAAKQTEPPSGEDGG